MKFKILERKIFLPFTPKNLVLLIKNHWDDYGFKTMFSVDIFDNHGQQYSIGNIKIGFKDQDENTSTYKKFKTYSLIISLIHCLPSSFL